MKSEIKYDVSKIREAEKNSTLRSPSYGKQTSCARPWIHFGGEKRRPDKFSLKDGLCANNNKVNMGTQMYHHQFLKSHIIKNN